MSDFSQTSSFQQVIEAVEVMALEESRSSPRHSSKAPVRLTTLSISRRSAEVRQDYAEGKVKFGSVDDFLVRRNPHFYRISIYLFLFALN
ncbi:hypothetical protein [Cylindrospermum sp. FACHB-282]|uniref:hypothetical protein n=1 Tax=Cylindrospermum sp. FACHB-282 TaxID=2692794 RepID=UPI001F555E29|nr:hypothetical protein [Cylindrospermum sp. FACHB-282]